MTSSEFPDPGGDGTEKRRAISGIVRVVGNVTIFPAVASLVQDDQAAHRSLGREPGESVSPDDERTDSNGNTSPPECIVNLARSALKVLGNSDSVGRKPGETGNPGVRPREMEPEPTVGIGRSVMIAS
jgi:hypothetical protein